jgi:hypothetical protein
VVPIDGDAKAFYLRFGFVPLTDDVLHLYYPVSAIEAELGKDAGEEE